jgi:hypothetical protein
MIPDNPGKPARKFGGSLKLIQVLICSHVSILNFFLRLCTIAQDIHRQSKTSRVMPPDEFSKRITVITSRCRYQIPVGHDRFVD